MKKKFLISLLAWSTCALPMDDPSNQEALQKLQSERFRLKLQNERWYACSSAMAVLSLFSKELIDSDAGFNDMTSIQVGNLNRFNRDACQCFQFDHNNVEWQHNANSHEVKDTLSDMNLLQQKLHHAAASDKTKNSRMVFTHQTILSRVLRDLRGHIFSDPRMYRDYVEALEGRGYSRDIIHNEFQPLIRGCVARLNLW